jgi:hypothetical protein
MRLPRLFPDFEFDIHYFKQAHPVSDKSGGGDG